MASLICANAIRWYFLAQAIASFSHFGKLRRLKSSLPLQMHVTPRESFLRQHFPDNVRREMSGISSVQIQMKAVSSNRKGACLEDSWF